MSYARFSRDSDVYVFAHVEGGYECCACGLAGTWGSIRCQTIKEMLDHLEEHKKAGDKVPDHCIERLKSEL